MRKIFPEIIEKLMNKDKKIFCLLGDIGIFSFRNIFKRFNNRILNMSTMEQTMLGFGAGLSKAGFIPIIHSITPFLILRALEQIKIEKEAADKVDSIFIEGLSRQLDPEGDIEDRVNEAHRSYGDLSSRPIGGGLLGK